MSLRSHSVHKDGFYIKGSELRVRSATGVWFAVVVAVAGVAVIAAVPAAVVVAAAADTVNFAAVGLQPGYPSRDVDDGGDDYCYCDVQLPYDELAV